MKGAGAGASVGGAQQEQPMGRKSAGAGRAAVGGPTGPGNLCRVGGARLKLLLLLVWGTWEDREGTGVGGGGWNGGWNGG